ncbi:ommochrome-binding protein [Spodoptera frugiperda]|uniref:Ommochrome-binding protein n=1 Tax=Spodoptera frugiperda TaxID=7108 RepID=A0A9R0DFI2_SPOFR|nr:ommochrome-binding protein [Spodoptera frugiperda]XP_050555861.1 ommochrome-binding protein [Spodoptera frugiperda]
MKHLLILFGLSALTTVISGKSHCHACFDSICYSKALIFQNYPISGQLAVDRVANVVYFHYEDSRPLDHTVAFDLDDIRFLFIPDIQFSFARAVDQTTRDVYIGGANGVYKYNPITNVTTPFALHDKTIWHMQFKEKIYYTIFMTKGLYTYEKKQSKTVAALKDYTIDDFIVDKKDDIYFMTNFTVYKLKKGENKATMFSTIIYTLTTDINDNAYFIQRDTRGLYKIDYRTGRLSEVGAFGSGSPFRTVFDNYNNIIYYDGISDQLFYLTPNYGRCKVTDEGKGRKLKKKVSSFFDSDV